LTLEKLEKQTIIAALRNGLGLTHACSGLQKSPKDISEYIRANPDFELELNEHIVSGYQLILNSINDLSNRGSWSKWSSQRSYMDHFINRIHLWESFCSKKEFSFQNFTIAIRQCKTIQEAATAMGFSEREMLDEIYKDTKLIQWLMQNGFII
jgi:hypothetical protein